MPEIRSDARNLSSTTSLKTESGSQAHESEVSEDRRGNSKSEGENPSNSEQEKKFNRAPRADAGPDINVNENEEVTLNAKQSEDVDGDNLSFLWTQMSPRIPKVGLKYSDSEIASFLAPQTHTKPLVLVFSVTVYDSGRSKRH